MKRKNPLFLLGLISLSIFIFFTFLVHKNFLGKVDVLATLTLQGFIPRFFDFPFSLFSLLGSLEIAILILLLLMYLSKKLRFFYVLLSFMVFHILELIGKLFVTHQGPPFKFFRYDIPFIFPSSGVKTGFSYPSGHMARTIFLSVIFAFIIYSSKKFSKQQKNILYFLIIVLDFLMFVSRIYLGEHWFSDVIGGSFLGFSFGVLSLIFI